MMTATKYYIPLRKSLLSDPRVLAMSAATGETTRRIVSALALFWLTVDDVAEEDGRLPHYTLASVDALVEIAGFAAAMPVGWLRECDSELYVTDFQSVAVRKAAERERKHKSRDKAANTQGETSHDVTPGHTPSQPVHDSISISNSKALAKLGFDESSRDDLLVSWTEALSDQVTSYAKRTFGGGKPPVFPGKLKAKDREMLLKVAALAVTGTGIAEAWVTGALEAIRHHDGPVRTRAAYFQSVLNDYIKTNDSRRNLNQLLAKVTIPKELLTREDK